MALKMTIGGAVGAFEPGEGTEVAGLLDAAFAADSAWRESSSRLFADLTPENWGLFLSAALQTLPAEDAPNLLALDASGGVFLPAHVQAVSFPLTRGGSLRCASLPGLRRELAELAIHWHLPDCDDELHELLAAAEAGTESVPTQTRTYCLLALAANEALRRDCPLWLVGQR